MERRLEAAEGTSRSAAAFGWGLLSASSLVLGAAIGLLRLPPRRVRAALMAFGGGALIEALSIELFAHIIETARGGGHGGEAEHEAGAVDRALIFLALGSALAGGLLFAGLDTALSNHGAFLRKASTVQAYVGRLRYHLMRRLIARLRMVPMFEVLETPELEKLARSMVKERYAIGSTIFQELSTDSSVFFLLSGSVDLTVTTHYLQGVTSPKASRPKAEPQLGDAAAVESPRESPTEGVLEEVKDSFRLGPNDIFGEMALFTGETVQAKAVANAPTCVLRIPRTAIHRLLASNRRLQDFVAMTAIDRLRETEVFCRCTPSTVARLVSFMSQAEFEAGDVLFYDVDALCPIYFVVLGRVQVETDGVRRTVCANGLLGTEHLVLGQAVHAPATALERTTVLIVQRSDIDKLCEKDERFRQALIAGSHGAVSRSAASADAGGVTLALDPPEGAEAPAKFGCSSLEELGWHRQARSKEEDGDEVGDARAASSGANVSRAPSEPLPEAEQEERRLGEEEAAGALLAGGRSLLASQSDLPDLLANEDAAAAAAEGKEGGHGHGEGRGVQAAIMIWLGILIDGVPESFVMGILANSASQSTLLAFVVGVFLANFPEAMSSAGTMRLHGMKKRVIMLMWASITVMTGLGAFCGALIFPPGSKEDPVVQKVIAGIEGLCGGAMLCMIANTVLPEAFEQGGNVTGLSTLLGFIVAVTVSVAQ